MKVYGYIRVSTKEQGFEQQRPAVEKFIDDFAKAHNLEKRDTHICEEKASGKDFERPVYQKLVYGDEDSDLGGHLDKGDLLVIMSLDRLGRNYDEVRKEWQYITETIGADIQVLDMPMLNTRREERSVTDAVLERKLVTNIVFELLTYVAQKERDSIKARQARGIAAMPKKNGKRVSVRSGRAMGRPEIERPSNFGPVYDEWKRGKITAVRAMEKTGLKKSSFYKLVKLEEQKEQEEQA